ncbi:protein of unknown function DUF1935 [Trypanosoma melophagium]|uniref:protein of unknown function DUF1935 n=1 Tax=Trypanosoma melophagium TaxID=715481 RepID=UPI003519ED88|nr:protein of unknown function DUF1935 [Trypanosoma melophagium]
MGSAVVKHSSTSQENQYSKYRHNDRKTSHKHLPQNSRYPTASILHSKTKVFPTGGVSSSTPSSQYRCGGPSILEGTITPALSLGDRTDVYWRRIHNDMKPDPVVLLYQIVVPRQSYDVWAFYNDTEDIYFLVTYHFRAHPLQTRETLRPLGATTLVWQPDGAAVAKLCVGPTETSLALMGKLVAYHITIEGVPRDAE